MLVFLGIKAQGIQSNLVASDQMWSPYGFRYLSLLPNFIHTIKMLKIKFLPKRASNSISYLVETALVDTTLVETALVETTIDETALVATVELVENVLVETSLVETVLSETSLVETMLSEN